MQDEKVNFWELSNSIAEAINIFLDKFSVQDVFRGPESALHASADSCEQLFANADVHGNFLRLYLAFDPSMSGSIGQSL